jgi:glucose/arabinose dehydrogenase
MRAVSRSGGAGISAATSYPVRRQTVAGPLLAVAILSLLVGCGGGTQGSAVSPSVSPQIALVPKFSGLSSPLGVTHAGDNTGKLYIVEQAGRIRLVDNGTLLPAPFLDISTRVIAGGEQGLLGLAFPPGYAIKRYFYVNYTTNIPDAITGNTVIARFRVTGPDPNIADSASEEILLTIAQPFSNHNGGQLAFGPDGFLYIGMGDGGSGGDPFNNAQNPSSLLGKMLRIDVESGVVPYASPPSNPFVQNPVFRSEIWALGLRNPWRFSFDRQTGDLYIADVGQNLFEEVDFQASGSAGGQNYGWSIMEGAHCFGDPACSSAGLILPVAEYGHGPECSITGGFVYRGQAFPRIQGVYLYADFCSGKFWGLQRDGSVWLNTLLLTEPHSIASFGEDEAGNLYAADLVAGIVYEIVAPN